MVFTESLTKSSFTWWDWMCAVPQRKAVELESWDNKYYKWRFNLFMKHRKLPVSNKNCLRCSLHHARWRDSLWAQIQWMKEPSFVFNTARVKRLGVVTGTALFAQGLTFCTVFPTSILPQSTNKINHSFFWCLKLFLSPTFCHSCVV